MNNRRIFAAAGMTAAALMFAGDRAIASPPGPQLSPTPQPPKTLSLSLADALQIAQNNNLTYQSAAQDVKIASARVIQAGAGRVPSLTAGYSYVHTQSAAFFAVQSPGANGKLVTKTLQFSATDINNINATLNYAIYSGGAVQAAIGQAAAGLSAAESSLDAEHADVIRDVTSAYFGLIQARRTAAIADQTVTVAQQNLGIANDGYRAGTLAKADVLREQVALANAQVRDIQANATASLDNATLANILNVDLDSQIDPTESLVAATPLYTLPEVTEDAQARRPELGTARAAVDIADEAVKSARSGTLPTIGLQVSEAGSRPNFVNVPQPQLSETLAVTWKLFDGGLTHGKVVEAQADVEKAKINLKQLGNSVDLEARQAYFNYAASQAEVSAAKSAQDSADESLRVSQLRFRSGVGTSLELSDALLADQQAQTQYVSAQADLRIALTELQRAAGLL